MYIGRRPWHPPLLSSLFSFVPSLSDDPCPMCAKEEQPPVIVLYMAGKTNYTRT